MAGSDVASGRHVSGRQLDILWEFLNCNRDIAVAYNRSLQAKDYSKRKWREIAAILNSQGNGAHKDWKGWSKYWVDYKAKLKMRSIAVRSSQSVTGGGPSTVKPLTEIELKFLQITGKDFGQGLPGVRVEPFSQPQPSERTVAEEEDFPSVLVVQSESIDSPLVQLDDQEPPIEHLIEERLTSHEDRDRSRSPHPTPSAAEEQSPRRRLFRREPTISQETAAEGQSPRHRRRRREPSISQEAARRALVRSSQQRADAAIRSSQFLELIAQGITNIHNTLERIER